MKKNYLFYLFATVCVGFLFTSCGKDDLDPEPDPPDPVEVFSWKDAVGLYKAEGTLKLTLNEAEPTALKEVTLAVGAGENAKITLTNIVPDGATVEIDNVSMKKDGDDDNAYTFTAESTLGLTTVSVAGSLTGIREATRTLNLNVTRKITSPLAGRWKLDLSREDVDPASPPIIYINVKTGDAVTDGILNTMLSPMLDGMLVQKVMDVAIELGEDGLFDVNWTDIYGSETGMPDFVKQIVSIQYFVEDGKVYLALDKSVLPLLAAIPLPEGLDIDLNAIISSLAEDRGGFIALPISLELDTQSAKALFYAGKGMLQALLPIVAPMLTGTLPEGLPEFVLQLIQGLPDIVAGAETFDIGLNFVKNN
ncbi:MAG: hypothetical protein LBS88_04815 [Tannerellaceae bacterium]|jgi:hypothetical protein|nr:hypothetical protein [Tannerellaceae bacterium]